MTRILFAFIFIFTITRSFACSCSPPSITSSYKGSVSIFIGQYLGPDEIGGEYGLPTELENFEVFKFIKGKDITLIKEVLKKYNKPKPIVSLLSSRRSSCGFTFSKDKYYIIYAYKSYNKGIITTDGCISTHEIEAEKLKEFLSDSSMVPEIIKLKELVKTDPPNLEVFIPDSIENYVPKVLLIEAHESLKSEINKRNTILWITIPTILLLLILAIFKRKK